MDQIKVSFFEQLTRITAYNITTVSARRTYIHDIYELHMRVSKTGGTPIAGWFILENPLQIDDLGVPPFQETSIWDTCEIHVEIDPICVQHAITAGRCYDCSGTPNTFVSSDVGLLFWCLWGTNHRGALETCKRNQANIKQNTWMRCSWFRYIITVIPYFQC